MSEFEKVSVIIPVYNSKMYLEQCIKSVINQTYKNLEIILVDDGSTDGSANLCDRFSAEDYRIVVIHKKNGGVSSARNSGIARASGTFLIFVDADDYISFDMVEQLVSASRNGAQIVLCRYTEFSDKNDDILVYEENLTKIKESTHDFLPFVSNALRKHNANQIITDNVFGSVCRTLFVRKIIVENNLKFDEELIITEDLFFLLKYITFVKQADVIDYYGYHYRKNDGVSNSFVKTKITGDYLKKRYENIVEIYNSSELLMQCCLDEILFIDSMYVLYPFIVQMLLKSKSCKSRFIDFIKNEYIRKTVDTWKFYKVKRFANLKLAIITFLIKKRMFKILNFYAKRKNL